MTGSRPTEAATREDVEAMRRVLDGRRKDHVRIAAILAALGHGLRRGEVCGLTVADFCEHDKRPALLVRTLKRRKEIVRLVPLRTEAGTTIAKYVRQEHGERPESTAPLFCAAGTRYPFAKGAITPKGIMHAIGVLLRATGCERRITAHSFRHGFATGLVQTGADLRTVQELLGHSSIASTQRYLHTTHARMREAVDRLDRAE